jgi:hypothetical protein
MTESSLAAAAATARLRYEQARERLTAHVYTEMALEAGRSGAKDAAVRRIMAERGLAATPAEKLAETDLEYAKYLQELRGIVTLKMRAQTEAESARMQHAEVIALAHYTFPDDLPMVTI